MARNKVGVPYENPTRYTGPGTDIIPIIKVSRAPLSTDVRFPLGQFWLVGDDPSTGSVGDLWYLCDYVAGVPQWCQIAVGAGSPGIDTITGDGSNAISPDGSGNVDLLASTVANATNAKPLYINDGTANTLTAEIQVGAAITGAPGDKNDAGLVSFDDTAFAVDANGYVTLVGGAGPAVDAINVDAASGTGTDPVVPAGTGQITVSGTAVAAASTPVASASRAVNAYDIEVQVASALASAPGDKDEAGLASFDSGSFSVDADGHVTLTGGLAGGFYQNLGFDLTSGRFQITQADGSALSSTNPGLVEVDVSGSIGQKQIISLKKPYKIDDDAHSTNHDMQGWYPFWDSGDSWNQDRPYFIYVIAHDTPTSDPAVGISQCPNYFTSPASTEINVSGTIASNTQESMTLFQISDGGGGWTTPTKTNYDGNPCMCIGSIRMQVTDTSNNDQTIQTLVSTDGVGRYQEGVVFNCAFGAVSTYSECFLTDPGSGGSITWTNEKCVYVIQRDGMVDVQHEYNINTGQSTNTNLIQAVLPYYNRGMSGDLPIGTLYDDSSGQRLSLVADPTSGQRIITNIGQHGVTSTYQNNTIGASDNFGIRYRYLAFAN